MDTNTRDFFFTEMFATIHAVRTAPDSLEGMTTTTTKILTTPSLPRLATVEQSS